MQLVSFIAGEDGYCSLLASESGAAAVRIDGEAPLAARAEGPIEEGRARLAGDPDGAAEDLEVVWSPAAPVLELTIGESRVVVHGVAAEARRDGERSSGPGIAWTVPDGGFSALRTVWAITAKSSLLLLVALRPEGAREHADELVGAARIVPRIDPYGYVEPLLSTEYDADGIHRRATLELWGDGDGHPERAGGTRVSGGAVTGAAGHLQAARFAWSVDGEAAVGGYEIVTP